MPPAWKVLTYATVVLVVFAVAATTWAKSTDPATLGFLFVTLSLTVGLGYYIGNNVLVSEDEE
ncbi:MAG: hypothetical protein ABEJ68_00750 [Halobacteriaceae archaeon]